MTKSAMTQRDRHQNRWRHGEKEKRKNENGMKTERKPSLHPNKVRQRGERKRRCDAKEGKNTHREHPQSRIDIFRVDNILSVLALEEQSN